MLFSFFMNLYHEGRAFRNIFHWGNYKDDRRNTMCQLMDFKALLTIQIWFSTSGFFQCPWTAFVFLFSSVQSLGRVWLFATLIEPQHARPPCPSPTPRVYPNLCLLSWWCNPTISSSVIHVSCHLQSFPASGSFQMRQFFTSGGQSIGVSASASVLPMNIQDWFPLGWTGWISLQSKGLSRVFSNTTGSKASILWCSAFFMIQLSHPYMTTGKTIALTRWIFVGKVMSLLLNMLSRLDITFLSRSKRLLISWLQSPSAVILEPLKIKSITVSIVSPSICYEVMGPDTMIFVFWMLSFKPTFSLSTFTFIRGFLVPLHFLP